MIKYVDTRYRRRFSYYAADEIIGKSLDLYGEYSQIEIDFLLQMLDQHSVVYDIGGNVGYHTTAFASKAKKVYTFEPNHHNFSLLAMNTIGLKNVQLMNSAVGAYNGIIKCGDYDPEISGNFGSVQVGGDDALISVPIVTIDSLELEKPTLIKIDVEGSEYGVFQGCMNTISKHMPVLYYEAHETVHFKEIYEMIKPLGYELYWAQVNNYNTKNLKQNVINVFGNSALFSVVALPPGYPELPVDKVVGSDDSVEKLNYRVNHR